MRSRGADTLAGQGRIAICIATCRRPDGLKALLDSLDGIVLPDPAPEIEIVVVDNDAAAPASARLGDVAAHSRWPLRYEIEPVAGVVAARNRLLDLVSPDTTLVAFLDDDETVSEGWLAALLATRARTGAAAVQGPVLPRFPERAPAWVRAVHLYSVGPFEEGQRLAFAGTGNLLIDKGFIDLHRLRFDMRFNRSGGEDQFLSNRIRDLGGTVVASAGAVAHELVPPARMTAHWVMRRSHRIGNTLGRIAMIRRRGRAVRLAKGAGAVLIGAATAATAGLVSPGYRMRGLAEMARGSGMLSGLVGVAFAGDGGQTSSE